MELTLKQRNNIGATCEVSSRYKAKVDREYNNYLRRKYGIKGRLTLLKAIEALENEFKGATQAVRNVYIPKSITGTGTMYDIDLSKYGKHTLFRIIKDSTNEVLFYGYTEKLDYKLFGHNYLPYHEYENARIEVTATDTKIEALKGITYFGRKHKSLYNKYTFKGRTYYVNDIGIINKLEAKKWETFGVFNPRIEPRGKSLPKATLNQNEKDE